MKQLLYVSAFKCKTKEGRGEKKILTLNYLQHSIIKMH